MMVLSQDLPIVLTLFGAAVAAIIAGSLLLPRGQIMVSEASSHAVLPGMVLGFLLSGEHGWLMLIGAIAVISLFLGLTSWLRRRHRLGASVEIAALFPLFFGAGVILLSLSGLDDTAAIDLDHILFGSLELILWLDVLSPADLLRQAAWAAAPDQLLLALSGAGLALLLALAAYPLLNRSLMDGQAFALMSPVASLGLRGLEIVLVATASAVCLRTAGVVVAVALFGAPIIGAWSLARRLWQAWLIAGVITLLGLGLSYVLSAAMLSQFGIEARLSGLFALCLVALAIAAPLATGRRAAKRPLA